MNKIYIALLIVITVFSCTPDMKENAQEVTIKTTSTLLQNGNKLLRSEEWYDTLGNCIKVVQFGSSKLDTLNITVNTFEGNLIHESIGYGTKGKELQKISYLYQGENNALSKQYLIKDGDTVSITSYTYYQNGKLEREVSQFPLQKQFPIVSVKNYDIYGNVETIFNQIYEDSTRIVLSRYEMNAYNNTYAVNSKKLIQVEATKLFGYYEVTDTVFVLTFRYDEAGNCVAQKYLKNTAKGVADSVQFFYLKKGIADYKIEYYSKSKTPEFTHKIDTITYGYDAKGRLISEKSSADNVKTMYEFRNQ